MRNKIILFLSLFLLVGANAFATESGAKKSFDKINNCVQKEDKQGCKDLFTASSASLYNRFMSYGLMGCLPKDAQYVSQKEVGSHVMIRASATDLGKQRFMRLFFVEEEGQWKMDVPESLRTSMGKNWEKQIELTEQIYLLMKSQLGAQLDCKTIRNLVKK
jgi:hypothetical protein